MRVWDDVIKAYFIMGTLRALWRLLVRCRYGIGLLSLAGGVALTATLTHAFVPTWHWIALLIATSGIFVAAFGEHLSLAWLVPKGLERGKADKLDTLPERAFASLLLGTGGVWLDMVWASGWTRPLLNTYAILAFLFITITWTHRRMFVVGSAGKYVRHWPKLARTVDALNGSRIVGAEGRGGTYSLRVRLPKGTTPAQIKGEGEAIESFYTLRPTSVQVVPSSTNGREVNVNITPFDPLSQIVPHPLPEPGTLSLAESKRFDMGVDHRGRSQNYELQHTLVVGANGEGKSVFLESLLVYLTSLKDAALVGIDMASGATLSPWERSFALPVATEAEEAVETLDALLAIVSRRERLLAERKAQDPEAPDFFEPSPSLPWVVVLIDELPDLVNDPDVASRASTALGRLMKRGRKAGVRVIALTQNGSKADVGSKEAQAQFKCIISFPMDAHSSKVLWKSLEEQGWSAVPLKKGQYKIRDGENRTPVTYKARFATPAQRSKHREVAAAHAISLPEEDIAATLDAERTDAEFPHPEVLRFFSDGEVHKAQEIIDGLGLSRPTIYARLNRLKEAGALEKVGRGDWRLLVQ